jgi:hypothetical protein
MRANAVEAARKTARKPAAILRPDLMGAPVLEMCIQIV